MSRSIDLSKPLSDEDREYLVQRARTADLQKNAEMLNGATERPTPVDDGNTGDIDAFTRDDGSDLLAGTHPQETTVTTIQQVEVQREPGESGEEPPTPEEPDNYDDEAAWSYRELQDEAKVRKLTATGSREELIARLRQDDASE